jgi:MFS family permease
MFFFVVLPYGISSGFLTIALPFVLTRAGFSVELTASIVALSVAANLWRFLWGPVVDLTLSSRRWYLLGLAVAAFAVLVVGFAPLHPGSPAPLMALVFLAGIAGSLIVLPVGGMIAHSVAEQAKGRAAGWYQAGNLGGNGLGGGAGVWLAAHHSKEVAAAVLGVAMLLSAMSLFFVADVRIVTTETLAGRLKLLGRDLLGLLRTPVALFTTVLVASPIGAGAMNNLWSAVGPDWHASDDRVALVTGVLNGLVSACGCVIGGWLADRFGRWWAFFGAGAAIALAASAMAFGPRTPEAFTGGVLVYAFLCGMAYAAFSAVILLAIGQGTASTKYAIMSSFGNLPVTYMTAFDGWTHDRHGTAWMLHGDALAGLAAIALALPVLAWINRIARREQAVGSPAV